MNEILYAGKHLVTFSVSRHAHTCWEFIYCTSGSGTLHFDAVDLPYTTGDVVMIPPNIPHFNDSTDGFTNYHVSIKDPTLPIKTPALVKADPNHLIENAFSAAFFHYSNPENSSPLLQIYGDLIVRYLIQLLHAPNRSRIVEEIESHIIQNYPDCDFELDTYLRSLPFSYDYLRKLFQKEMGITPHKYLSDKRLEIAASRLSSDQAAETSVTEIAHLCGFREPLYFSRMFKKRYGVSPSFYQNSGQNGLFSPEDSRIPLDS